MAAGGAAVPTSWRTTTLRRRDGVDLEVELLEAAEARFASYVWPAAEALASWLWERGPGSLRGFLAVELGAGLALPSVVACACGAEAAIATDADYEAGSALLARVDSILAKNGVDDRVTCYQLSWGDMDAADALLQHLALRVPTAPLFLAADVLYDSDAVGDFFATAARLLHSTPRATLALAYHIRSETASFAPHLERWALRAELLAPTAHMEHAHAGGRYHSIVLLRLSAA